MSQPGELLSGTRPLEPLEITQLPPGVFALSVSGQRDGELPRAARDRLPTFLEDGGTAKLHLLSQALPG